MNLDLIRNFYLAYFFKIGQILQTPSAKLADEKSQTLSGKSESRNNHLPENSLQIGLCHISSAPKVRFMLAQGNALGKPTKTKLSPERAA